MTGVVLAAGAGTRMGGPKAELVVHGVRLIDRAVAVLSGCDDVLAVVRAGVAVAGARTVVNPDPARGMRSSLAAALSGAADAQGLLVLLVDTPGVGADAVAAVTELWREHGGIAMASFGGRSGHPILMSRRRWAQAVAMAGPDEGARGYLAEHGTEIQTVPVRGDPADLDTPAELARWLSPDSFS